MQNRGMPFTGTGTRRRDGNIPLTDPRAWEQMLTQQTFPSVFREFVHPGEDPRDILMRCIFKDERELNAAVLYLAKCREFGLDVEEKVLLDRLAGSVSVRGLSRRELAMVSTGIIAPSLWGVREWGKGGKDKRREEQAEQ